MGGISTVAQSTHSLEMLIAGGHSTEETIQILAENRAYARNEHALRMGMSGISYDIRNGELYSSSFKISFNDLIDPPPERRTADYPPMPAHVIENLREAQRLIASGEVPALVILSPAIDFAAEGSAKGQIYFMRRDGDQVSVICTDHSSDASQMAREARSLYGIDVSQLIGGNGVNGGGVFFTAATEAPTRQQVLEAVREHGNMALVRQYENAIYLGDNVPPEQYMAKLVERERQDIHQMLQDRQIDIGRDPGIALREAFRYVENELQQIRQSALAFAAEPAAVEKPAAVSSALQQAKGIAVHGESVSEIQGLNTVISAQISPVFTEKTVATETVRHATDIQNPIMNPMLDMARMQQDALYRFIKQSEMLTASPVTAAASSPVHSTPQLPTHANVETTQSRKQPFSAVIEQVKGKAATASASDGVLPELRKRVGPLEQIRDSRRTQVRPATEGQEIHGPARKLIERDMSGKERVPRAGEAREVTSDIRVRQLENQTITHLRKQLKAELGKTLSAEERKQILEILSLVSDVMKSRRAVQAHIQRSPSEGKSRQTTLKMDLFAKEIRLQRVLDSPEAARFRDLVLRLVRRVEKRDTGLNLTQSGRRQGRSSHKELRAFVKKETGKSVTPIPVRFFRDRNSSGIVLKNLARLSPEQGQLLLKIRQLIGELRRLRREHKRDSVSSPATAESRAQRRVKIRLLHAQLKIAFRELTGKPAARLFARIPANRRRREFRPAASVLKSYFQEHNPLSLLHIRERRLIGRTLKVMSGPGYRKVQPLARSAFVALRSWRELRRKIMKIERQNRGMGGRRCNTRVLREELRQRELLFRIFMAQLAEKAREEGLSYARLFEQASSPSRSRWTETMESSPEEVLGH